ncbi:MAG TPA: ribonuclease III [Oceanicaulis sp.]|jgi:ribonuclease-3|uniref:Ribonuclease 3 n=1 Tax=Glycocaulis albus TaxID=1382801 RepID=A0ABQ1XF11_9PROT|nr:ribonuclease III [Glycocaulis albus]MBV5258443.1 ribonuclease III [Synechococcus moorigangaii CMS01]GGG92692.1 ribonuclease 3 [Glycocaulis albus]HCY56322.1 ribonuclease III [Oceanicaulis sp.]
MTNRIKRLEDAIGYQFSDPVLLETALTHASHGDGRRRTDSNERMEFLGDRVLGLLVSEQLYAMFEGLSEGGLAHRLNALVNKGACARVARSIGLGDALLLSPGEDRLGGRDKESILGDACEALIGAIYLDGGLSAARAFFASAWEKELAQLKRQTKDAKSHLQEWAARKRLAAPAYETLSRKGPDHRPHFTVEVRIDGLEPAIGEGNTKQAAQRAAAEAMLKREHAHDQ